MEELQKRIEELEQENKVLRDRLDVYEKSDLLKVLNDTYKLVDDTRAKQKRLEDRFNTYESRLEAFRQSMR